MDKNLNKWKTYPCTLLYCTLLYSTVNYRKCLRCRLYFLLKTFYLLGRLINRLKLFLTFSFLQISLQKRKILETVLACLYEGPGRVFFDQKKDDKFSDTVPLIRPELVYRIRLEPQQGKALWKQFSSAIILKLTKNVG